MSLLTETIDKMVACIPAAEDSELPVDALRNNLLRLKEDLWEECDQRLFGAYVPMIMLLWLDTTPEDLEDADDEWLTAMRQPFEEFSEAVL